MAVVVGNCPVEAMPAAFRELAWHVFFASRGRGVSLDAHFPWLRGGGRDDRAWHLTDGGQPAAMLCVRHGILEGTPFRAIGLVCTAPAFERRGHATRLLEAALDAAGDAPVLLWTGQHGFYARLGFELIDPTLVATCTFPPAATAAAWLRREWAGPKRVSAVFGGPRGLPTFATAVERWEGPQGSLLLTPADPPIVLDMDEDADLASVGAAQLVVNLPRRTPWLDRMGEAGVSVTVRETRIAMWRPGRIDRRTIAGWDVPLLDRF
jgi:GNAT superfamily N-acetyltransferase